MRKRRGVEMTEFALAFLPMMAFLFGMIDMAYLAYSRVVVTNAVREGVRYAITNRVQTNDQGVQLSHDASIRNVVRKGAMGILQDTEEDNQKIVIRYWPDNVNRPGNLVIISVSKNIPSLLGLMNSGSWTIAAKAADRMGGGGQ